MSVLLAASLVDWQAIRFRGIARPSGQRFIELYQDLGSLPTPPSSDQIIIWFNVLQLWHAGYDVILLSSGTATCSGNNRGIIPTSQFVKVCWLATTLWTGGIDLTLQAMTTDPDLRRLLPPSPIPLRLRSRSPQFRAELLQHLHCFLRPYRYGHDAANPALTVTSIARFLEQQADQLLSLDCLHHLFAQRSVQQYFHLVGTAQDSRLVPRRSRRTLPAPIMSARATREQ